MCVAARLLLQRGHSASSRPLAESKSDGIAIRPCRWGFASRGAAFAVTTPAGVAAGLLLRRGYSASSPAALIVNGAFNGASAGILLYMSLVDLIAIDFFSARMRLAGAKVGRRSVQSMTDVVKQRAISSV